MHSVNRTFIIAEAGVNHNGSLELAKELIDIAAEAGADAVKFQSFVSENVISKYAEKAQYQLETTDPNETQLEMVKKYEFNLEQHYLLLDYCKKKKIEFLSTPFDLTSADWLVRELDIPRIKISSGDLTNAPLLLKVSQSGKQVLLSTGMSTLGEIEMALSVLAFGYTKKYESPSLEAFYNAYISQEGQEALAKNVVLLHCTTEYPTPYTDVNLRALETLNKAFHLPVGFSDHTLGIAVSIAAVAMGAAVIEKHFTISRELNGPDHRASLEPDELKEMVRCIRQVEQSLGSPIKIPTSVELKNKSVARKSLVALKTIKAGEEFTKENITVKRPGDGISPMFYWDFIGNRAEKDYLEDEVIRRK